MAFTPDALKFIPKDALQAQREKDERAAQAQREKDELQAQGRERARDERARPIIDNQDEEFRARAERVLGPRLQRIEARLAELEGQ
jgi:hypothetical protein